MSTKGLRPAQGGSSSSKNDSAYAYRKVPAIHHSYEDDQESAQNGLSTEKESEIDGGKKEIAVQEEASPTMSRIKALVLLGLCVQNTIFALITRYSRTILHECYSSTEVTLAAELVKATISGAVAVNDTVVTDAEGAGLAKLWWLLRRATKVLPLVVMYSAMNLLSYFALARIDISVYTVVTQLKSLSTAAMAVLILRRHISFTKWRALLLLVIGSILVAMPAVQSPAAEGSKLTQQQTADNETHSSDRDSQGFITVFIAYIAALGPSVLGLCATLMMVLLSGTSAVYFESVLKSEGEVISIWERNFQLASYSAGLLTVVRVVELVSSAAPTDDSSRHADNSLLFGWSIVTVLVALAMAGNGIFVAATLKFADAVLKTLASAGSIVLATILGVLILSDYIDLTVTLGCVCTILAIVNYTFE